MSFDRNIHAIVHYLMDWAFLCNLLNNILTFAYFKTNTGLFCKMSKKFREKWAHITWLSCQLSQNFFPSSPSIVLARPGCSRIDLVECALASTPRDAAIIGLGVGWVLVMTSWGRISSSKWTITLPPVLQQRYLLASTPLCTLH